MPLSEWTDEELAAVLLSQLWRHYDAAGESHGRGYAASLAEGVLDLTRWSVPEDGSVAERPQDAVLLRDATRRNAARIDRGEPYYRARGHEHALTVLVRLRGVETLCEKCKGLGSYAYASTATWQRGGAGGQTITLDVCDECWGTGDARRAGADLRRMTSAIAEAKYKISGLATENIALANEVKALKARLATVHAGVDNVWFWQGDGGDRPDSLSCPVVMSAETLRTIITERDDAQSRGFIADRREARTDGFQRAIELVLAQCQRAAANLRDVATKMGNDPEAPTRPSEAIEVEAELFDVFAENVRRIVDDGGK